MMKSRETERETERDRESKKEKTSVIGNDRREELEEAVEEILQRAAFSFTTL